MYYFSLSRFFFFICFQRLNCHLTWYGFLWFYPVSGYSASWVCKFMSLDKLGKFSAITFYAPPSLYTPPRTPRDINTVSSVTVPQIPQSLFFKPVSFPLLRLGDFYCFVLLFTDIFLQCFAFCYSAHPLSILIPLIIFLVLKFLFCSSLDL